MKRIQNGRVEFGVGSVGLLSRQARLQLRLVLRCESPRAIETVIQLLSAERVHAATDLRSRSHLALTG